MDFVRFNIHGIPHFFFSNTKSLQEYIKFRFGL